MLGYDYFYYSLIRKYVAIFGHLFNDIRVMHTDTDGNMQNILVPIAYGPRSRYVERTKMDPDLQNNRIVGITLPRIAYEIMDFSYAKNRNLNSLNRECAINGSVWAGQPWDIVFKLSIISRTVTDGNIIAEQILPFFTPSLSVTAELIPEIGLERDIPITLNDVQFLDTYADDWLSREYCLWEMMFTMEAWFYGPSTLKANAKLIKFANVSIYPTSNVNTIATSDSKYLRVTVQPGLTANGEPTTNINDTIPYNQIESDDPWDFIVQFKEN